HLPSGENFADASPNFDCTTGWGLSGRLNASTNTAGGIIPWLNDRYCPSGEIETGLCHAPTFVIRSSGPLRSAGMRHIVIVPTFQERKQSCLPSGVQTGAWLRPSVVIFVITSRPKS